MSRLDRYEPELNENAVGDLRDTTSPRSMAVLLAGLLYGRAGFEPLHRWMAGSRTGKRRIRAGVPNGWRVGNKTGTAPSSARALCDVAFLAPPVGSPMVLAVYCDRPRVTDAAAEAVIAAVARICTSR